MPIYEFVCQECGNAFERVQSWSDLSTPVCSECASANVVRRLSPPAIHFKGSGWYVTDSKKGNKNGAVDHGTNGAKKDSEKESEKPASTDTSAAAEKQAAEKPAAEKPAETSKAKTEAA